MDSQDNEGVIMLRREMRAVGGLEIELIRGGSGRHTLVLHGFHNLTPEAAFLRSLAGHVEVLAPSLPGFGATPRPDNLDTVYDLVHSCRDLIDALNLGALNLVGVSFGGWLALELAAGGLPLERLALVDTLGLKLGGPETRDIADVFNLHPDEVRSRSWHDPELGVVDFDAMTDDAIVTYARNRESLCLYGWEPYMHTPALRRWLHRVRVPTLVLWGESDRIVDVAYGRALSGLLGDARFETIPRAGHHPELEQPRYLADRIGTFFNDSRD
jgi:pimeloyl-ACP methyl ester carboxylesterase